MLLVGASDARAVCFWNEVPYTRVEQGTYSTESETLPWNRDRYHKTVTRSSLTVCPCVRTHLRCRYAWVALSRSLLRCGMLEYRCLARTYAERTYPEPADSVSLIKEKPSILSHTSTDIWHRFKFQQPMFTTYWFQLFAFRNILNQFLHIWYSLAISFTTKFESQKLNYFWYFAILLSLRKKS